MTEPIVKPFVDKSRESEVRHLYDLACCAAEPMLRKSNDPLKLLSEPAGRRSFFRAAHTGFAAAQDEILKKLVDLEKEPTTPGKRKTIEFVFRKIMDAVAWQMIHEQLYIARRLFRGHRLPRLLESNVRSVAKAADIFRRDSEAGFALIADLTTFVQVGDLLVVEPDEPLSIVEVKEGSQNKKIWDFAKFLAESQCPRALYYFERDEGKKSVDQLKRMLRQSERMSHVASLIPDGSSVDPDTAQKVTIPKEEIQLDTYDDALTSLLTEADAKGAVGAVLDGCLFVGAYKMGAAQDALAQFVLWFLRSGGREGFPLVNQLRCMTDPLALPIFTRKLAGDQKFDLLFGRSLLLLALDWDKFRALGDEVDVSMRWMPRREFARWTKGVAIKGTVVAGQDVLVAEKEGARMPITQGLVSRILFHGTRPQSAMQIVKRSLEYALDAHQSSEGV